MTFFFDNNFSPKYVEALRVLGKDATHLRSRFPPDTKDEDWLPQLRGSGLTLVTLDTRIWRNPQLRALLLDAQIVSFIGASRVAELDNWRLLQWLIGCWEAVEKERAKCKGAATFRITINGKVEPYR